MADGMLDLPGDVGLFGEVWPATGDCVDSAIFEGYLSCDDVKESRCLVVCREMDGEYDD